MQAKLRFSFLAMAVWAGLCWTTAATGSSSDFELPQLKSIGPQAGRISVQAQFLTSIVPKMTEGKGVALSAYFGPIEGMQVGLHGTYFASSENSLTKAIRLQGVDPANPAFGQPLADLYHLHWLVGANLRFTPMNAQLSLTRDIALDFEFYFPMGVGLGHLRRSQVEIGSTGLLDTVGFDTAFRPVVDLGLGARAYVTHWLALSAEFRGYLFAEPSAGLGGLNTRPYLQIGLQLSWGSDSVPPSAEDPDALTPFLAQRIELSAHLSADFYDRFTDSFGFSGAIGYHLLGHWHVEAFGTKLFSNASQLSDDILSSFSLRSDIVKQTELLWAAGATLQFIPLSGRLNVLGRTLAISPYVGVGVGVGAIRAPCDAGMRLDPDQFGEEARCPLIPVNADPATILYEPNRLRPLGVISGGIRIRLADHFALRVEVKDHVYSVRIVRPDVNDFDRLRSGLRHAVMSQVGLSILLGGS